MEKIIIDAENGMKGRIASFAAKQALLGKEIAIFNCEKALISGEEKMNLADFKFNKAINTIKPTKGPFFSRDPEKIMKRAIRGMLPDYRRGRGREAWKIIRCYQGVPEEFKNVKAIKIESKMPRKTMSLARLGKLV